MRYKIALLIAVFTFAAAATTAADLLAQDAAKDSDTDVAEVFAELFGPKIEAAKRTSSKTDDVETAREMMALAPDAAGQPKLMKMILLGAFELASSTPTGYSTAVEALQIMERQLPDEKAEVLSNRIKLRQKMYRLSRRDERQAAAELLIDDLMALGDLNAQNAMFSEAILNYRSAQAVALGVRSSRLDQIKARMTELAAQKTIGDRAAMLKNKLEVNPKDSVAARELVLLFLLELNQPVEAGKYIDGVTDEGLLKAILAATDPSAELSADDALELGDFYNKLAETPTTNQKPRAYQRALGFYQQYLSLQPEAPRLTTFKIKVLTSKIEKWLTARDHPLAEESAGGASAGGAGQSKELPVGRWVDLSPYILTLAKDLDIPLPVSTSIRQGNMVRLSQQELWRAMHFYIAARPQGSYRFQVSLAASTQRFSSELRLPVGTEHQARLRVTSTGMSLNRGSSNSAQGNFPAPLQPGKLYLAECNIAHNGDEVMIQGAMNNQKIFEWSGSINLLALPEERGLINITNTYDKLNSPLIFSSPRLFIVDGSAEAFNLDAARRADAKNVPMITQPARIYASPVTWSLIGRIEAGKTYQLESRYGWRPDSDRSKETIGAAGDADGKYQLQARIGINGTPVKIGAATSFTAKSSGALYMTMSDEKPEERYDNFGYLRISISPAGVKATNEPTEIWHYRSFNIQGNGPWIKAGLVKAGVTYRLRGSQSSDGGLIVPGAGAPVGPAGFNGRYALIGRINGGGTFRIARNSKSKSRSQTRFITFKQDGLLEFSISRGGPDTNIRGQVSAAVVRWGFAQDVAYIRQRELGYHRALKQEAGIK